MPPVNHQVLARSGFGQGLIDVGDDVVDVFQAYRDADEFRGNAGGKLGLRTHLTMAGGGGVQDQGFGVADIGQVAGELDGVDEFFAGGQTAFNAEAQNRPESALEIPAGIFISRVLFQAGVLDPYHARVLFEVLSQGQGVAAVVGNPQGQGQIISGHRVIAAAPERPAAQNPAQT